MSELRIRGELRLPVRWHHSLVAWLGAARRGRAGHGAARRGAAGLGMARHGAARQGWAGQGKGCKFSGLRGVLRLPVRWHHSLVAWLGWAGRGAARLGAAGHG